MCCEYLNCSSVQNIKTNIVMSVVMNSKGEAGGGRWGREGEGEEDRMTGTEKEKQKETRQEKETQSQAE